MDNQKLLFTKEKHTFFNEFVAILCSHASFSATLFTMKTSDELNALADSNGLLLIYESTTIDMCLSWKPYSTLKLISENLWPSKVELILFDRNHVKTRKNDKFNLTNNESSKLHQLNIQSSFTSYYERFKPLLWKKFNKAEEWPNTWRFARIVRNAYSHDGKIDIRNQNTEPVSWKTLTYGPSDNGKDITGSDITIVDIFFLMLDMDKDIKNLTS